MADPLVPTSRLPQQGNDEDDDDNIDHGNLAAALLPNQQTDRGTHNQMPASHDCTCVHIRSDWYDNSTITEYIPAEVQDIIGYATDRIEYLRIYAIPLEAAAPLKIAARVDTRGDLLYLCPHNPLQDRPLLEIEKLIEKTSNGKVILVVILPEAESLELALTSTVCGGTPSACVRHQAGWSDWLCKLDTGVFANLILILPFVDRTSLQETHVWQTVLRRELQAQILA